MRSVGTRVFPCEACQVVIDILICRVVCVVQGDVKGAWAEYLLMLSSRWHVVVYIAHTPVLQWALDSALHVQYPAAILKVPKGRYRVPSVHSYMFLLEHHGGQSELLELVVWRLLGIQVHQQLIPCGETARAEPMFRLPPKRRGRRSEEIGGLHVGSLQGFRIARV